MNKKANVTLFFAFTIAAIVIVVFAAILAPMGVLFNAEAYAAGEMILQNANESIQDISDPTVKASVEDSIQSAFDASQNNIDVNASIFQYGWILIIVLVALVVFLASRRLVEYGGTNFV